MNLFKIQLYLLYFSEFSAKWLHRWNECCLQLILGLYIISFIQLIVWQMCCLLLNTFCLINTYLCKWATDNVHVPNTNSVTVCQNWKCEIIQYVCTLLIHFLSGTAFVYNVYTSMMFVVVHSGGKLMASGQLRKLPTLCGIVINHQVTTFRAVFICDQNGPLHILLGYPHSEL